MTFSRNDVLLNHISNIHIGIKNFRCEECGARFPLKVNLQIHINETHLHLRKFKCDFCEKCFARNQCYKTFYARNLRIYAGVCTIKLFTAVIYRFL
jgi:hypothetical protein